MENLLEKHSSFFSPHFYFECGDGWYDILDDFFKMLSVQKLEVTVAQVKEKYGDLRIYVEYEKATLLEHNLIRQLIQETETKSRTICEICGKKGKIEKINGWYSCRCTHCRIMYKLQESKI